MSNGLLLLNEGSKTAFAVLGQSAFFMLWEVLYNLVYPKVMKLIASNPSTFRKTKLDKQTIKSFFFKAAAIFASFGVSLTNFSLMDYSMSSTNIIVNALAFIVLNLIFSYYGLVDNSKRYGFLEKVYENALVVELNLIGLPVVQQAPVSVCYEGETVGEYIADLIVDGKVVVEIKAVTSLEKIHGVQLVNYLKATKIEVGLLLNFGPELQIKRKVFTQR